LAEADQGVQVLRLHGKDRLIDVDGVLRMSELGVQARNPQTGLDVVGVGRGQGLKLLQRGGIGTGIGHSFGFGAGVLSLWRSKEHHAQNGA
jgi:hypothetical protein